MADPRGAVKTPAMEDRRLTSRGAQILHCLSVIEL
jgi:hypothetical protein